MWVPPAPAPYRCPSPPPQRARTKLELHLSPRPPPRMYDTRLAPREMLVTCALCPSLPLEKKKKGLRERKEEVTREQVSRYNHNLNVFLFFFSPFSPID